MNEIESDFSNYEHARAAEGGPHPGRSDPSRQMLFTSALVVGGLVVVGLLALALIG